MALRRALTKRLLSAATPDSPSPIIIPLHPPALRPSQPSKIHFRRYLFTSPNGFPSFLTLPVGEKLRERFISMSVAGDRKVRLDGLSPPPAPEIEGLRVDATDAKKLLRIGQMEQIRERLRNIPASTIPYDEFARICDGVCGNRELSLEFAKALDESGNVVVLGSVVFLHPDQVAKSIESLISQSIFMPNDPRRNELEILENQKNLIDQKARSMVLGELYCGLGFIILQTLGFMRLTFWELSWDVMEPICFFVTSLHFVLAYAFFLRTSKEPSFEGYISSGGSKLSKKSS
ncbi:hypothetical protein CASFOL_015778 [Castilleja foliolosa]|uniref:Calcium uniporter protein C-terminal domain-containing protein n=1 Tax=Castilleja foliolosa TaxID=1961234 RepID=A0ABD3DIZ0_9LAMI